ncbi:MAG: hypothetical protein KDK62_05595 [Chlamydiia bacterium]|nr:hypothetical protein [Chlamydiia bacterium]
MDKDIIALFGEAEKGTFHTGTLLSNLMELEKTYGHPPPETKGLLFAVQTLLYRYKLLFFRVEEEGFHSDGYLRGFKRILESDLAPNLLGLGIPGLSDQMVLDAAEPIMHRHHPVLILTEADLYDLLSPGSSLRNWQ